MTEPEHRRPQRWWFPAVIAAVVAAVVLAIVPRPDPPLHQRVEELIEQANAQELGEVTLTPAGVEILFPRSGRWATINDHEARSYAGLRTGNQPEPIEYFQLDEFEKRMDEATCETDDKQGVVATTNTGSLVSTITCATEDGGIQTLESNIDGEPVPTLENLDAAAIDNVLATFASAQDPTVYHVMLDPEPGEPLEGPLMLTSSRVTHRMVECGIDTTISGKQVGTYMMTRCDDNEHTIPYDDYDLTELSGDAIVASMDQALADRDAQFGDIHHVSFYHGDDKLWAHVSFKDPDIDTWIEELD